MAEPEDHNALPPRELASPLARAREIEAEHRLWVRDRTDAGGRERFAWQRARDLAWDTFQDTIPGWSLYRHWRQYRRVLAAVRLAGDKAGPLLAAETGATVEAILAGLLPSLLEIAKWVGLGAVIGGAIGALGGPADEITVPGGALAGAEVGLWVANSLGLASLLVGLAKNLGQFVAYAKDATEVAWYAGEDHRTTEPTDLAAASRLYAQALAELWLALLQALVAEVLRRAGEYTAKRMASGDALRLSVNEITQKISGSKLGPKTAAWFQKNFEQIRRRLEERKPAQRKRLGEGDTSQAYTSQTGGAQSSQPATGPGSAAHKAQRWKEYQERGGTWDYDRWSKAYDNNMQRATSAHAVADAYRDQLGWGEREVTVDVEGISRRLDIADVATQRGVEVKSGYQSLTEANQWELLRDQTLVEHGWDMEWHFTGTASQPLVDALKDAGIRTTGPNVR